MSIVEEDILKTLKCSMCDNYLSCAPVIVKLNGTSVCGRCNIPDEEQHFASDRHFPCRYKQDGCRTTLKMAHVKQHEAHCAFHELKCPSLPSASCPWLGPRNKLLQHYEEQHDQLVLRHPCIITPNITRNCETNMITCISKELFLLQVKTNISTDKLYHCVRYIGHPEHARKYKYNFEITSNKGKLSKTCQVLAQEDFKMFENSDKEIDVNGLLILLGRIEDIQFSVRIDSENPVLLTQTYDLHIAHIVD